MITMQDSVKLAFDFFKHLTTLNTACILLMAGLVERVFVNPVNTAKIENMFLSFVASLLGSLGMMILIIYLPAHVDEHKDKSAKVRDRRSTRYAIIGTVLMLVTAVGFLYGLLLAKAVITSQRQPAVPIRAINDLTWRLFGYSNPKTAA